MPSNTLGTHLHSKKLKRALILDIVPHRTKRKSIERNIKELLSLVETAGGIVIEKVIQKRKRPSAKTFLGTGKIQEVSDFAKHQHIDLIIISGTLKPNQYLHLGKIFPKGIKIWDRVDLILNIFDRHANAPEAKMQIKLARLHHEIPKIYARDSTTLFERAGAGIGTRGAGEKGIEEEKRHIRRQIKSVEKKLESLQKKQASQRRTRKKTGMPVAALVGYTNAGKSSLMRTLTKKQGIKVNDALFVTLETKIGKVWLPEKNRNVLIADTIGFIRDLPPELIKSFLMTLQEAREADLLLHVIDISDPEYQKKVSTVEEILTQIGCSHIPKIYILNKIDKIPDYHLVQEEKTCFLPLKLFTDNDPICISAEKKVGIKTLLKHLGKRTPYSA